MGMKMCEFLCEEKKEITLYAGLSVVINHFLLGLVYYPSPNAEIFHS